MSPLEFDFELVYNDMVEVDDLNQRKKILVNAIADRDFRCLKNFEDPKNVCLKFIF